LYGPTTTAFFYEPDILNGLDSTRYNVDTSMTNFHRWTFVDQSYHRLVDLGNIGTAARPMFFSPRTSVGRELGFRAFDAYGFKADEVKYYDTRSPYTDMYYVQGGLNREILNFGFTQNVNPRLNFGFRVHRISSKRQYGTYAARGASASLARNWSFLLHASYFSKNRKYVLLSHIRTLNHSLMEQGGVILADTVENIIGRDDYHGPARLHDSAKSWHRRTNLHVYQHYKALNGLQFFNQLEFETNQNRYRDNQPSDGVSNGVYPVVDGSPVLQLNQRVRHYLLDNKIGFKGHLSGYRPCIFL